MVFSNWNLYASLGFHPDGSGGIGDIIFTYINDKIRESNDKMEKVHKEYEIAFDQLRATEILLRNASSEGEVRRLRAEYQSRYYHMQSCLDLRNQIHNAAAHYHNFHNFLIKQFEEKFPEYFQEIYDAEMQDFKAESYDDRPCRVSPGL